MNRTYRHEWKHPEKLKLIKEKQRAYRQRPDIRERQRAYNQRPDIKEKQRAYRQRPENKEKQRAYMSAYNRRRAKPSGATPEGGAARIAEMRLAEG